MNDKYKAFINDLYNGLTVFYPESVFGEERGKDRPFYSSWFDSAGKKWKREEFREYILIVTKTNDTDDSARVLRQWKEAVEKNELLPNMPPSEVIEKAREIDNSPEEPERKKKEQQQLFAKTPERKQEPQSVVFLEPEKQPQQTELNPQEKLAIENFEKAARENPREFVESFSKNIIKNLPADLKNELSPEELEIASKNIAADFLGKILRKDNLKSLASGAFVSLINSPNIPEEIKKETISPLVELSETSETVVRSFLYPSLGKKVTEYFYEDPKTKYRVTPNQTPNSVFRVDLGQLQTDFQRFKTNPIYGFLEGKIRSEITKHGKKVFSEFVSRLPKKGIFNFVSKLSSNASLSAGLNMLSGSTVTYQATNLAGWAIEATLPDFVPMISYAAQRFGINVGLTAVNTLTPAAVSTIETGAITVVGTSATGAAEVAGAAITTAAGEAAAAAITEGVVATTEIGIGTAGGPVGLVLSAAVFVAEKVGKLIKKIGDKVLLWIKKNPKEAAAIGLAPFALGFLTGSVSLMFIGVATFSSIYLAAQGMGAVSSGIISFTFGVFTTILSAAIGHFGKAITFTLLGIIVFTALVLFIINSGAYIVPPGTFSGIINDVHCEETGSGGYESPVANAAVCIVSYLNQLQINPLVEAIVSTPVWQQMANLIPPAAYEALTISSHVDGHLQCVGFASASAGYAFDQNFIQINACSYISNAPAGYTYHSGTSGIASGDFFLIDGKPDCSSSPGHIGVVLSVDGALISCADANMVAAGYARVSQGCFALSQLSGYFRKN